MKFGYYSDSNIPKSTALSSKLKKDYKINSYGYRCPEWKPLPVGKKNVVVLGCSHTFGEGLEDGDIWVDQLYKKVDQKRLRFWNLGEPGASADKVVRILYATEKVLFPKLIVICWPFWSRRERLDTHEQNIMGDHKTLESETEHTDKNNFLKNVFFAEKFAEKVGAKIFHCFAQDVYKIPNVANVFSKTSIKLCWPYWSKLKTDVKNRIATKKPSLAKDGLHYGVEHHKRFAELLFEDWKTKLK
jgi:hypothetical protein